jgi:hypothetical protein
MIAIPSQYIEAQTIAALALKENLGKQKTKTHPKYAPGAATEIIQNSLPMLLGMPTIKAIRPNEIVTNTNVYKIFSFQ